MFKELKKINTRPKPFEFYTADELWTDEYTSKQMLSYHLNKEIDLSSRNIDFINKSVEWIINKFNITEGTKIADFGCGPGLYSTKLAQYKASVTGIDFSTRSIQYAQDVATNNNLSIDYINANYLDFETNDRFDLIIMIMCDFCALSPAQRKLMLNKFHTILKPSGSVLLDVYSLKAYDDREETTTYMPNLLDGFWSPENYYGFLNTFKYDKEKIILDKYTIIQSNCTRTIYNWLQYFSIETIKKEFETNGFKINELYSDVAGSPLTIESKELAITASV